MIKLKKFLLICIPIIIVFILSIKNTTYGYKTEDLQKGDILIGDEIYNGYINPNQIVSSAINHYMKWKNERLTIYKYDGKDLIDDHKWLFLQDNNEYAELSEEGINELEIKRYINEATKKLDLMNDNELQQKSSFQYNDAYYVYENDIKNLGVLSPKNIYGYIVYKNKEIIENKLEIKNVSNLKLEDYKNKACDELFVKRGYITYEDFYAAGDGKTNDANAIYYAHECANKLKLPVKTAKKTYYISHMPVIDNKIKAIQIKTDVNWNNATIIIDDKNLTDDERKNWVFMVPSTTLIYDKTIKVNYDSNTQAVPEVIDLIQTKKTSASYFYVGITSKNDYVFRGNGDEDGIFSKDLKSDYFKIDKNGKVLNDFFHSYNGDVRLDVYEVSDKELKIENVNFITKPVFCLVSSNKLGCSNTHRDIRVQRPNTIINNITHNVIDNDIPTGYNGFIFILNASNITLKNSKFAAHAIKNDKYSGSIGGTYDLAIVNSSNVIFDNISYSCENDESMEECYHKNITDTNYFGITGCNNVKDWTISNSILNRVDSHKPSQNIYINNSILGHSAVNVTGGGNLNVENTSIDQSEKIVFLRADYGGTWNGNININNIYFNTKDYNGKYTTAPRILMYFTTNTFNAENGGFGYPLYIPSLNVSNVFFDEKNYIESMSEYHKKEYTSSPGIILAQNTAKIDLEKFKTLTISQSSYNYKSTFVGDMKFSNIRSVTFDKLKVNNVFAGNNYNIEYTYLSGTEKKTIIANQIKRWDRRLYNNSEPINIEVDLTSLSNKSFSTYYKYTYYETVDGVEVARKNDNAVDIILNKEEHPYCLINIKETKEDDWYKDDVLNAILEVPKGFDITDYGIGYTTSSYDKSYNLEIPKSKTGVFNLYGYVVDDKGNRYNCIKLIKKS